MGLQVNQKMQQNMEQVLDILKVNEAGQEIFLAKTIRCLGGCMKWGTPEVGFHDSQEMHESTSCKSRNMSGSICCRRSHEGVVLGSDARHQRAVLAEKGKALLGPCVGGWFPSCNSSSGTFNPMNSQVTGGK